MKKFWRLFKSSLRSMAVFQLGAQSNKSGWGQRNREEIGLHRSFARAFAAFQATSKGNV